MKRWLLGGSLGSMLVVSLAACEDETALNNFLQQNPGVQLPDAGPLPQDGAPPPNNTLPEASTDSSSPNDAGAEASQDAGDQDSGPANEAGAPPACDDGHLDPGETCEPLASCPTQCVHDACQKKKLENGGTCSAACVNDTVETLCKNDDGCCPSTGQCNATNDNDCTVQCNNGVKEGNETCDPLASCPQACPPLGCQLRTLQNAGTCTATCAPNGGITECINNDGCCPAGGVCNSGNDSDCAPGCGNNVLDPGEACDPLSDCPSACPMVQCTLRSLINAGTCNAQCVDAGTMTSCVNNDGCCPSNCNATNDSDCKPSCGNLITEPPEKCDGNCPTACPPKACQLYKLVSNSACDVECVADTLQDKCIKAPDGCCPAGCNANNDGDCEPKCGNGVVEPGETCDPESSCKKCSALAYTCFANRGDPKTCDVSCNEPILKCGDKGDSCCPFSSDGANGCGKSTDDNCLGDKWEYVKLGTVDFTKGECANVVVQEIVPGGSYEFTTCIPPGESATNGDPSITSIIDAKQNNYPTNNDCSDPNALPNLAGWSCRNTKLEQVMACASPSPGGFMAQADATALQVTICPAGGVSTRGTAHLYVWYNAPKVPKSNQK